MKKPKKETLEEKIYKLSKEYTVHDIAQMLDIPEGHITKILKEGRPWLG